MTDAVQHRDKPFDIAAYLDRVGLDAPPPATAEGLATVQRAHRLSIPFENFDILLGRGIDIGPEAIFEKLVLRGRGGYCFEQNALFEAALRALGFAVRPLLARVWLENPQETPPATHQLELVEIDGADWIADAGFGGSFTPPMPLAEGEGPAAPDGALHRLRRDERFGWMLERRGPVAPADGRAGEAPEWQRQYSFTTAPAYPADLATSNHWTSTRPGTRFTSLVVASQVTEDGFVSLTNRALRISGGADKGDVLLEDAQALRQALRTHFGIALDEDEAETLFARGRG